MPGQAQRGEAGDSWKPVDSPQRNFACERCSRRKQRCDKAIPTCGQCHQAGSQCAASSLERNVVQISDNEVIRKGYVTALQEQIASIEVKLRQNGLALDADDGDAREEPRVDETSPPQVGTRQGHVSPELQSQWPLDATNTYMTTLSLSAMAEPQNRAGEFLKNLSMPRIIASMTETYGGNPEVTARVDALWDGIAKYIRHPTEPGHRLLVQKAEAEKALETYIEVVDFRFPRLPRAKARSGIDAITAADDRKYQDTLTKEPAQIFIAYMVIAIVPLVSDQYPVSQGSFVSLHILAKCLRVLDRVFSHEDGVDIIQCLHLLVIFAIHCSAAGSAWHLIGFAMNKCIALGYHREAHPRSQAQESGDEIEQRRWAFWGCYLLDRLICAALGRPFAIADRYVTVSLPGVNGAGVSNSLQVQESLHVHLYRYAQLLSTCLDGIAQNDFNNSLSHLLYWRASTPSLHESQIKQAYLQQTSLFHMLMLRIAVRDILPAFDFNCTASSLGGVQYRGQFGENPSFCRNDSIVRAETARVAELKLIDICRAVARSLDRTRMTGRHYLSLTTGYYALTMALATLYYLIVTQNPTSELFAFHPGSHQNTTSLVAPGNSLEIAGWETEPGVPPLMESQLNQTRSTDLDNLLDLASQKLEIVGRQFPRMLDYRQMVQLLRRVVADRGISPQRKVEDDDMREVTSRVTMIGPDYLRHLAQAIIFFI